MTKTPERIWAEFGYDMRRGSFWDEPSDQSIEYIHADHALALVAAERELCAVICDENQVANTFHLGKSIRARTADDAQAALDKLLQEARNEALWEAAEAVYRSDLKHDAYDAILALITEEHSDDG